MDRYIRQSYFSKIGEEGQKKLGNSYGVIIGCGALGTVIANNLARAGVGRIKIVDRDFVEITNLQRQVLFTEEDVKEGIPKAAAAANYLKKVNSEIEIAYEVTDVNASNIERIISGADILLDGTDNFEVRFLINDACIKNGIPWVYGGAVGSYGITMNILPGKTPCFQCLLATIPAPGTQPTCDTAGILGMNSGIIGCYQSVEALKILTDSEYVRQDVLIIDIWKNSTSYINLEREKGCSCCEKGEYKYLNAQGESYATSLCGRDAVQVVPAQRAEIDFAKMAEKLGRVGKVEYNKFLFRLIVEGVEITLFADGRAIIKNINDTTTAKNIYAKYIGM